MKTSDLVLLFSSLSMTMTSAKQQNWKQQKKKGFKRKKNSSFSNERAKKKQFIDDTNLDFSAPLKESTLIDKTPEDDEAIQVDDQYDNVEEEEKQEDANINKMRDTIKFLRSLLSAKDDILNDRDKEKCFLLTKVNNLEALLIVKDKTIQKLTTKVDKLAELANELAADEDVPKTTSASTEASKKDSIEVVQSPDNDNIPTEDKRRELKRKCKFEDKGKCKNGSKCLYVHPKQTCQEHGKLGLCQHKDVCQLRHPVKICFQWEKGEKCSRGDQCRFRHPLELLQNKHFLGKRPPLQQHPQLQAQPILWKPNHPYKQHPQLQQIYVPNNQNIVQPWSLPMNNFWLRKQSL